jgi:hypothetical protein
LGHAILFLRLLVFPKVPVLDETLLLALLYSATNILSDKKSLSGQAGAVHSDFFSIGEHLKRKWMLLQSFLPF